MSRVTERGDTIVEVLFAVAIFSLVIVGALSLMNQGSAASQRALEITLVRQQIDAQAETIRYLHDSYVAVYDPSIAFDLTDGDSETSPAEEWHKMIEYVKDGNVTSATSPNYCPDPTNYVPPEGSFFVNPRNGRVVTRADYPESLVTPPTWAQIVYGTDGLPVSEGIWVEAVRTKNTSDTSQSNFGSIDFHIRACWDSPGLSIPMTIGTIVRLYEPRQD